jgi:predicted RNA-binding Zn ribbon-like protein
MAETAHAHDDQPGERKSAPGDLSLVQSFVNTLDIENRIEKLDSADSLRGWLAGHGLLGEREPVSDADFGEAIALREAIRKLLLANNGAELDSAAVETLNNAGRGAELTVRFDSAGDADLAPVRAGFPMAVGRLLAIIHRSMADGTWERFKACPHEDGCEWAFYDYSKNRSSTWCAMQPCGNRAKARAYRERRQSAH